MWPVPSSRQAHQPHAESVMQTCFARVVYQRLNPGNKRFNGVGDVFPREVWLIRHGYGA